jgi:energy-coupling factor transport system ATP-binding protein
VIPGAVIRCEDLVYMYPDGTRALDGLDLTIEPGTRVAIAGRNGSGKSTLIRHWNGLLRPASGRVLVGGMPISDRRVAELAKVVGMTFQDPDRQLFAATCRQEVAFGARNVGLRAPAVDAAVDDALELVGLATQAGANPSDLGPSWRRLLAIASVLAMQTPVVVLDEPTLGLDTDQAARVAALVEALAAEGRTVVAISHDARFIAGAFERVVRLDAGQVIADDPATRRAAAD